MVDVRTICVLGAGDMGHGVAELAALRGFEVRLRDIDEDILDQAHKQITWSLEKLASRDQITQAEADAALDRVHVTTDLADAIDGAALILEAVPENLGLKQRVFQEVEGLARPDAIFASNTSTMRITEIGAKLDDPSRLVGMHFFNPVLLMDLIEIIPSEQSSDEAVATAKAVADRLGKTCVTLSKDTPGFVTSRLIGAWINGAIMAYEHDVAEPEVIDSAMKFKAGFPMGPFELADYTGLDISVHAGKYMASRLGEAYTAAKTLQEKVDAGKLGKKSGEGFYTWKDNRPTTQLSADKAGDFDTTFILAIVANEAARLVEDGVASAADIDLAMRNGCAFPKGPLEWADDIGLDNVVRALEGLYASTKHVLTQPSEELVARVKAGKTGREAGEGFHTYASAEDSGALETVRFEVDDEARVGTITLDRGHRLHALNDTLLRELGVALDRAEQDERVRVILLTATGEKAFCVGADLQDADEATPATMSEVAHEGHQLCLRIEKCRKPVVAAINGYAFGGGLELTLPCDFRVAAKRAKLALPEVTLGLLPAMGGTQRLPKLIGLAAAKEVALLGERLDADRAREMGLVHRVFDNETFREDAHAFAAELAKRAPLALGFTKRLLNVAPTTDMLAGMEMEAAAFGVLASTDDVVEGVSSMFMKKTPEFKGK